MSTSQKKMIEAEQDDSLILTPLVNEWLMHHSNDAWPDWVADRMAEEMKKVPRDRSGSFSASAAGTCLRRQEFSFLGKRENKVIFPQLHNLFNDGKWRHLRWQAMLLTAGLLEDIEVPLSWPRMLSKGSMDGRGVVPNTVRNKAWRGLEYGFELKGVGHPYDTYTKRDVPIDSHMAQIHRYFVTSGLPLFVVIYESKQTQEWKEFVVEPIPELMEASLKELEELRSAVDKQELHAILPECMPGKIATKGAVKQNQSTFRNCPFGGTKDGVCRTTERWG